MQFKDYIIPLLAALGITMAVQYYMADKAKDTIVVGASSPGREHFAPDTEDVHRPLQLEVDFDESSLVDQKAQIREVTTDYAQYAFSTEGASLSTLSFKHQVSGPYAWLPAVMPEIKEHKCFLIACDSKTPYHYTLINDEENDQTVTLTYTATASTGKITKTYIIDKHACHLDMAITFEPTSLTESYQMRVLFPSPVIGGVLNDAVQGVVAEKKDHLVKKSMSEIGNRPYWDMPPLFGTENRYFVFSLIKDQLEGIRRAYFKVIAADQLISILETKKVTGQFKTTLRFYMGPKRSELMDLSDMRLSQTLEYGWFTPISRGFVQLLNMINDYVKNYGIAIIILTLLIKLLMLPLTWQGEKGMKKQLELQRKMAYLQQKYKNDKEALATAQADLMRTHGMGGMAGCLPMLIQIPIFICLNKALANAVELFGAPFLWVPDLAAKDPYYILPLLAGGSLVINMIFSPRSAGTGVRQNMSMFAFALLFGAFATSFAAGLSLYLFVNMLLTTLQSWAYSALKKE